MKKLQAGDTCYVRRGDDKKIRKAIVSSALPNGARVKVSVEDGDYWLQDRSFSGFDSDYHYRLVYPYPCIKEVAI